MQSIRCLTRICLSNLLLKLNSLGIEGQLLNWFASYLEDRSMTVRVAYEFSDNYECTSGVSQCVVLSPLLFLLYTARTSDVIRILVIANFKGTLMI